MEKSLNITVTMTECLMSINIVKVLDDVPKETFSGKLLASKNTSFTKAWRDVGELVQKHLLKNPDEYKEFGS